MPLDPEAYDQVFRPRDAGGKAAPGYVIAEGGRPAPGLRLIYWTLIGPEAAVHDEALTAAWRLASEPRGEGAPPFVLREIRVRCPTGALLPPQFTATPWPLAEARWPIQGDPATTPCSLHFPTGLHLAGPGNRFLSVIHFDDLIRAACQRVERCLPEALRQPFRELRPAFLEMAERCPATLRLRKAELEEKRLRDGDPIRYFGLLGSIELPKGPGNLWPLLLAIHWLHAGRHFAEGLGHMTIEPLSPKSRSRHEASAVAAQSP
jgi:hypothetical protein